MVLDFPLGQAPPSASPNLLLHHYIEIAVPISATQAFIKVDTYGPQRYTYLDIVGEADLYLGFDKLRATPGVVGQS